MLGRVWISLLLAGLIFLPLSCAKIPEAPSAKEGEAIDLVKLSNANSIPLEWGRLISVNLSSEWRVTHLWFQDEGGTVRMALFDHRTMQLGSEAILIPRK
jgi:hypothetical protein